ncbi:hypothetical protein CDV55_104503 [Aspergillus turcosus]|nr:hypothetical protein CDV55_104503 [Aspergillus turcosus]
MSTPFPDYSPLLRSQAPVESSFRRRRFIFQVKNDTLAAREPVFLEYGGVEPSIGSRAALSLDSDGEIEAKSVFINYNSVTQVFTVDMPTAIPNCYQAWIINQFVEARVESGFLTAAEYKNIWIGSNTRTLHPL